MGVTKILLKELHVKFNTMVNSNKPKSIWNYQFCKHLKNQIALKKANQLLDDLKSTKGISILECRLKNATEERPFLIGGLDLSYIPDRKDVAICGYTIFAHEGRNKDGQKSLKMIYKSN